MTKLIEPRTLPGFRDFLPQEAKKRSWLKAKLIQIFENWGYDPIETPTLEFLEMFTGQIGEDEKLFFSFKDQGGRDVALRYDQTVPIVRVLAQYENQLIKPLKRYQIQPAFRAEKPQKGRYREFLQADADIFGDPTPWADAETICLAIDIYRQLGFKQAKVLINDRNLMATLPYEAIVAIDKIKKIGEDGVLKDMESKNIPLSKAKEYLNLVLNLKPNETIKIITNYLKNYGIEECWFEFDPTIARSFAYSEGPIWEVIIPEFTSGSVLGGERYDRMFKNLFGKEMSGTGFALGFDRTLEAADQFGLIPVEKTASKVLVTTFNEGLFSNSLQILKLLRSKDINSEMFPNPTAKLDKQLKYADQKGIPYAVIIGPDEAAKNLVTIKNLRTKEQKTVAADDLIDEIK
jgi:histidyl-tRNA synthetase